MSTCNWFPVSPRTNLVRYPQKSTFTHSDSLGPAVVLGKFSVILGGPEPFSDLLSETTRDSRGEGIMKVKSLMLELGDNKVGLSN